MSHETVHFSIKYWNIAWSNVKLMSRLGNRQLMVTVQEKPSIRIPLPLPNIQYRRHKKTMKTVHLIVCVYCCRFLFVCRWTFYDETETTEWGDDQRPNEVLGECDNGVWRAGLCGCDDETELANTWCGTASCAWDFEWASRGWAHQPPEWHGQCEEPCGESSGRHRPTWDCGYQALHQPSLPLYHCKWTWQSWLH